MSIELRAAHPDEMREFHRSGRLGFGQSTADAEIERDIAFRFMQPEWTLCAFDDGVLAAKMATLPLEVHWNGGSLRCGGVTAVTTLPTHRRRGYVRQLMTRSFAEMRDSGQPVAMLWASMAAIYQRFGYGMAFASCASSFEDYQLRFVDEIETPGAVHIVSNSEAMAVTSTAYDRFAEQRVTALDRDDAWRAHLTRDMGRRGDSSLAPLLVAVYEEAGEILGYAIYDIERSGRPGPGQEQQILVYELVWLTPAAHRALVQFFAAYDLVSRVHFVRIPVDDPLFHQLQEPRSLGLTVRDGAFLRVIDLKTALEGRGYGEDGHVNFRLDDPLCPWNSGDWQLEAADGRACLRATQGEPSLLLTPRALAMLVTGHMRASTLVRLGLARCVDAAALRPADRLFETACAPFCLDRF